MEVIINKFQKQLGYVVCKNCGSILHLDNTDTSWGRSESGKIKRCYLCAACSSKQFITNEELVSFKKAIAIAAGREITK